MPGMVMTSWQDHVVYVELFGADAKPTEGCARFLANHFGTRGAFVGVDRPGVVEVRSEPEQPVTAGEVAAALAGADLPASAVHERLEWCVGRT